MTECMYSKHRPLITDTAVHAPVGLNAACSD